MPSVSTTHLHSILLCYTRGQKGQYCKQTTALLPSCSNSPAKHTQSSADFFPAKTKPSYQTKTSSGGVWTVFLIIASFVLSVTELRRWYVGTTTHTFSVEKGISHDLQINIDLVVAMKCEDVHINVQDASGDRILAGSALTRAPTMWSQWGDKSSHRLEESEDRGGGLGGGKYEEEDVHDYLGAARRKRKFKKTPGLPRGANADSCRVFGSLEGNKVQGDFHITARGHGYMEFGQHLDHNGMWCSPFAIRLRPLHLLHALLFQDPHGPYPTRSRLGQFVR